MSRSLGGVVLSAAVCAVLCSDLSWAREKLIVDVDKDGKEIAVTVGKETVDKRGGGSINMLYGVEAGGSITLGSDLGLSGNIGVPLYYGLMPFPKGPGKVNGIRAKAEAGFSIFGDSTSLFWMLSGAYFDATFKEDPKKKDKIMGTGWFAGLGLMGFAASSGSYSFSSGPIPMPVFGVDLFQFNPGDEKYTKWTVTAGIGGGLMVGGTYTMFF